MSVNDEDQFPWLTREKRCIYDAIETGKSVSGIYLDAQLIASWLGAAVYQSSAKEIGWLPVQGVLSNDSLTFNFFFPSKEPIMTSGASVESYCLANR